MSTVGLVAAEDRAPDSELAELFGHVARALLDESGHMQATLQRIVDLAHQNLEHVESVGISIVRGRRIESPAASTELARAVDRLQDELDEGPCYDAARGHESLLIGRLDREARWPNFAPRAHRDTGVTSVMSVRMFVREDTVGAMNIYSTKPNAFDEGSLAVASVFATHAAVAYSHAQEEHQLRRRADSRDLIGQAKGILMSQRHITSDAAFTLLTVASQRLNMKVTSVAEEVTYRGELP